MRTRTAKEMARPACAARIDLKDLAQMASYVSESVTELNKAKVMRLFCKRMLAEAEKEGKIKPCNTYRDAKEMLENAGIFFGKDDVDWQKIFNDLDQTASTEELRIKEVQELAAELGVSVEIKSRTT